MTSPRTLPYPLGVSLVDGGANFAVYSETADAVEFCLFDDDGTETRVRAAPSAPATSSTASSPSVAVGTRYGLRVARPVGPGERACATTRASCCSTRYATAIEGEYDWGEARLRPRPGRARARATTPTRAASMPRCVVDRPRLRLGGDDAAARSRSPRPSSTRSTSRASRSGTPTCPRRSAAPTPASPTRPRSSTSPTSASPPSSCCPCTSSCRTATCWRRACATTGATTPSASSPRTTSTASAGARRRAGRRVQGHGQGPARRRPRGHPRRRLQPHRRGQPHGPDAVVQGHRQRRRTTASSRATEATTSTPPAPATASTSATRPRSA